MFLQRRDLRQVTRHFKLDRVTNTSYTVSDHTAGQPYFKLALTAASAFRLALERAERIRLDWKLTKNRKFLLTKCFDWSSPGWPVRRRYL